MRAAADEGSVIKVGDASAIADPTAEALLEVPGARTPFGRSISSSLSPVATAGSGPSASLPFSGDDNPYDSGASIAKTLVSAAIDEVGDLSNFQHNGVRLNPCQPPLDKLPIYFSYLETVP